MATMTTTIRIEPSLKTECCNVLQEMGMSLSSAINIFLKQVALTRSIPFEVKADPFYSEANQRRLRTSYEHQKQGLVTEHELIDAED